MVVLDRQDEVGPGLLEERTGGCGLRVQRVQSDPTARQIQAPDQLPRHGNLVGLVNRYRLTAPIVETGHVHGVQEHLAAATLGGLPVDGHQFLFGGGATNLMLESQDGRFDLPGVHGLEQTAKRRLTGGGKFAPPVAPDPQRPPLTPAHLPGKLRQILLAARGPAQIGQRDDRQ